jgi:hypothetical protein
MLADKLRPANLKTFLRTPKCVFRANCDTTRDTTMAKRLLKILEKVLAIHVADRDRLTKRLARTPH